MNSQKKLLVVHVVGTTSTQQDDTVNPGKQFSQELLRIVLANGSPIQEARRSTDTETIEFDDGSTKTVPRQRWLDNSTGKIYNSLDEYLQAYKQ